MASYRYVLCDLLTDQLLAVLPLTGVTFDRHISRQGSLSATLDAPTPQLIDTAKLAYRYAGRSALWVYRDGQLWWGGIPWTVQATQGNRGAVSVSISAATFDSYAHHRLLYADKTYAQADDGVIVPDLWRTIQADTYSDIGVQADDQPTGTLRDRTYLVTDQAMVGQIIENLGDVIDGPEHTIDVFLDSAGNRVKRLRVGKRLGSARPTVVFQRASRGGGRVDTWTHSADASNGGTAFQVRGATPEGTDGAEVPPLLSDRVERNDLLSAGWPRLDVSEDYSDVTDVTTLDGYAQAAAATSGGAANVDSYVVSVGNTGWSPNRLGEAVRVKILDAWHSVMSDRTIRPVACSVSVGDNTTPEMVTLSMEDE